MFGEVQHTSPERSHFTGRSSYENLMKKNEQEYNLVCLNQTHFYQTKKNTKARVAAFGKLPEIKFNVQNKQSLLLGIIYKPHPVKYYWTQKKERKKANKLPARMTCTV